jgi:hypothetical protein
VADPIPDESLDPGTAIAEWRECVNELRSIFSRLVFLSCLRDQQSGRYSHPALCESLGAAAMDAEIRTRHQEVFSEWMNLTVAQQTAEVLRFLPVAHDGIGFLQLMRQCKAFGLFLPPSAPEVAARIYAAEMEAVMAVIENRSGRIETT